MNNTATNLAARRAITEIIAILENVVRDRLKAAELSGALPELPSYALDRVRTDLAIIEAAFAPKGSGSS